MKRTYHQPACLIVHIQGQQLLTDSYKVNAFTPAEIEELGGDAPASSAKSNPVNWEDN